MSIAIYKEHEDGVRAGTLLGLPVPVLYFILILGFSIGWGVLRALFGLSFEAAFGVLTVPFLFLVWFSER